MHNLLGWRAGLAAIGLAAALASWSPSAAAERRGPTDSNKAVVLAFYKLALQERRPAEAFDRYADAGFIEHSQDSSGGSVKATVEFLTAIMRRDPEGRWGVVRSAAEGDLVFLHTRYVPAPKGPEIAVVEIFRLRGGKLVEHWDVISGPPDKVTNPISRF